MSYKCTYVNFGNGTGNMIVRLYSYRRDAVVERTTEDRAESVLISKHHANYQDISR
jgi:hypothetical protein